MTRAGILWGLQEASIQFCSTTIYLLNDDKHTGEIF
jgi:hypothetical protein